MPYNTGAIDNSGGNLLWLSECTDAWALKTPALGTTSFNLGHLSKSDFSQTTSKTEYKSEDGEVRNVDFEYIKSITGVLMQRSKAEIDLLGETVKSKYYLLGKRNSKVNAMDAKTQELFALVRVTPQFKVETPGGTASMPFEATVLLPSGTITFTGTSIGLIETAISATIYATGASITNTTGYVIKET